MSSVVKEWCRFLLYVVQLWNWIKYIRDVIWMQTRTCSKLVRTNRLKQDHNSFHGVCLSISFIWCVQTYSLTMLWPNCRISLIIVWPWPTADRPDQLQMKLTNCKNRPDQLQVGPSNCKWTQPTTNGLPICKWADQLQMGGPTANGQPNCKWAAQLLLVLHVHGTFFILYDMACDTFFNNF